MKLLKILVAILILSHTVPAFPIMPTKEIPNDSDNDNADFPPLFTYDRVPTPMWHSNLARDDTTNEERNNTFQLHFAYDVDSFKAGGILFFVPGRQSALHVVASPTSSVGTMHWSRVTNNVFVFGQAPSTKTALGVELRQPSICDTPATHDIRYQLAKVLKC